ncbi:MAG: hypothetical protein A2020_08205 [Lentisphaerae bacterium GWF2_45_14]|nr:MAG: hypothetical protein A2020_08205 [Lentisphaerae bacterium GWF2_45_14]
MKLEEIPRIKSAFLPTPLEYLPNLSAYFKNCRIWMKRDELTGHCFGGNKERKLEYILADAQAKNADSVVTVGALQSNHCRMTVSMARKLGIKTELILIRENEEKIQPQPEANYFLDIFMGAEIHIVARDAVQSKIDSVMGALRSANRNPYFIESGGHNALGAMGYVNAFLELQKQLSKINEKADHIIFPTGTGTTHAGLAAGALISGFKGKINGISVARKSERCLQETEAVLQQIMSILNSSFSSGDLSVYDEYVGNGYGLLYDECIDSMKLLADTEGTVLDPVYNAKAFHGMADLIKNDRLSGNIIYINTGGLPGIFNARLMERQLARITREN